MIGSGGEHSAEVGRYRGELSRSLSVRDNVLITLSGITPASSLFVIAPAVISGVGGAAVLSYSIAAFVGVAVALCYAELSSAFPITGGEYAFVARTMGKPSGFALFGLTLVSGVFVVAVIASGVGTYLAVVWPGVDGMAVGLVAILLTTIVGCFTIGLNARVTGIFLILELIALAVVAVLGFLNVAQPISTLWTATTAGESGVLVAVSAGMVVSYTATALFSYNGYGNAVYFSEETRKASTTIARAILWSLLIAVLVQLIPLTAVVLGTPSMSALVGADDPLSYFVQTRGGAALNNIVSLGIAIAVINAVLAITLQNARMLYSSARDRTWPDRINGPLARIHPRFKTPVVATVVVGISAAVLLAAVPFEALLITTGATVLIIYGFVAVSALLGRANGSTSRAAFRMPLWPAIPLAMLAATIFIAYQSLLSAWLPVAVAAVITVLGLPYYYLFIRRRRGERWTLPDPADDSG
jgi:amino acid transporter